MPSFSAARKVGKTGIIERETGNIVQVDVRREEIGPYITYTLNSGRKELGFLTMNLDSIYPIPEQIFTLKNDNIPKITNLRTLAGEKYAGIGTSLIKLAIKESKNNGSNGNLWLNAEKGYGKTLSPYRSDENPIPFYYKLGFKALNEDIDQYIQTCLDMQEYNKLPAIAKLVLMPEAVAKFPQDFTQLSIFKDDNQILAS